MKLRDLNSNDEVILQYANGDEIVANVIVAKMFLQGVKTPGLEIPKIFSIKHLGNKAIKDKEIKL